MIPYCPTSDGDENENENGFSFQQRIPYIHVLPSPTRSDKCLTSADIFVSLIVSILTSMALDPSLRSMKHSSFV